MKSLAVLGSYLSLTLWPHPLLPDRSYAQTDPSLAWGYTAAVGWAAYGAVALALRGRSAVAALAIGIAATVVAAFIPLFLVRAAVWSSSSAYFPASAAASPRSAKAWYDLGLWLKTQSSDPAAPEQAEAAWRRALEILPNFHRASYELAESLARRGQPLAGAEVYEGFLELVPDDTGALTNVTRLLLDAGQPQRANAYAQRLVQLKPESEEAREVLLLTEAVSRRRALTTTPISP